jgi:hypothetical protein
LSKTRGLARTGRRSPFQRLGLIRPSPLAAVVVRSALPASRSPGETSVLDAGGPVQRPASISGLVSRRRGAGCRAR